MDLARINEKIDISDRTEFMRQTYSHLLLAILGFIAIEAFLFNSGLATKIVPVMLSVNWLIILGAFMIVGQLASSVSMNSMSLGAQYAALTAFVLAEAIIFLPLLYVAQMQFGVEIVFQAGLITALAFSGLTAIVFMTRKDFSFMGIFIKWAGICALLLIAASVLFSFQLGIVFAVAMVCLAGGAILYDTSNIIHHYPNDRYVSAALKLFASVALMLYYVIIILMERR